MIPYEFNAERFSRWMAYVLRHNPSRYGLEPDRHGFVDVEAFIRIAKSRHPDLDARRLEEFIAASGAGRFEVSGAQVRARYGHSIPAEPVGPSVEPPATLYFGTEAARTEEILKAGLSPADRRVVHLSATLDEALTIARRKTEQAAVIAVRAQEAHRAGVAFYHESAVYLVAHVPAQFLTLAPVPESADHTGPPPEPLR